jgi:hypothetical protein
MTTTTRHRIEEAVRRLGLPTRAERIPCPRHPREAPAAILDPRVDRFRCPRCGAAGDAIDLVAAVRGLDREAARAWLLDGEGGEDRPPLEALLRKAVSTGPEIAAERRRLGVSDRTLRRLGARYVVDYRRTMLALVAEYPMDVLRRSGLFNRREHLIFYRHRLVLPYREEGRVVHLVGLGPGEIHLRGRRVPVPFNLDALAEARGEVVLTAAVRDAVVLEEWGCPAVAAPEPPGLVEPWIPHFAGHRVLVLVDEERGGRSAAEDRADLLRPVAKSVDVVELPGSGDAASVLRGLAGAKGENR